MLLYDLDRICILLCTWTEKRTCLKRIHTSQQWHGQCATARIISHRYFASDTSAVTRIASLKKINGRSPCFIVNIHNSWKSIESLTAVVYGFHAIFLAKTFKIDSSCGSHSSGKTEESIVFHIFWRYTGRYRSVWPTVSLWFLWIAPQSFNLQACEKKCSEFIRKQSVPDLAFCCPSYLCFVAFPKRKRARVLQIEGMKRRWLCERMLGK